MIAALDTPNYAWPICVLETLKEAVTTSVCEKLLVPLMLRVLGEQSMECGEASALMSESVFENSGVKDN